MIQFRPNKPEDLLTVTAWIEQDPMHQHISPGFFLRSGQGVSCYAIEDEKGPIIFVRQETQREDTVLHTQFPSSGRKRIVAALREGYPLVAEDARRRGFKRVRFDSQSPALIRTMLEMGFKAELVAEL